MIPRHDLARAALAPGVEGRIHVPLAERLAPVAVEARGDLEKVGDAAVATRQQRLEPSLARVLVHHPHLEPPGAALDRFELSLEVARLVEGRPLERGPRLGHEGGH